MRLSSGHMATTVANRTTCRQCRQPQRNPEVTPGSHAVHVVVTSTPASTTSHPNLAECGIFQSYLQVDPQQDSIAIVARLDKRVAGVLRVPAIVNDGLERGPQVAEGSSGMEGMLRQC
jgi:hypothetical protein